MEERAELQGLHRLLQFFIYLFLFLDIAYFIAIPGLECKSTRLMQAALTVHQAMGRIIIYSSPLYSRLFILILICLASIGTLSKKQRSISLRRQILFPLAIGLLLFFLGLIFFTSKPISVCGFILIPFIPYTLMLLTGAILLHSAMDNVSKIISTKFGKDKWNMEAESFEQETSVSKSPLAVSIPMLFYYRRSIRKGFINIENIFRGTLLIGTPGSGKSFGVVMPFIRQLIDKQFCICLYDFKFVRNEAV